MYPTEELRQKLRTEQLHAIGRYSYTPGDLYAGFVPDKDGRPIEIGFQTKRHALTIAGARSGKGAGIIIPNLLRWPHNALVIDPKGEAAEATAEKREAMGQAVHVLDPFEAAKVPQRLRARFNPLQSLDPGSRTIREDIGVIADGLVLRHDPRAAHWDGGALSLIAGLIAHVLSTLPKERRNLPEIRRLLTLPSEQFGALIDEMAVNNACGNLPASAASRLTRSGTEAGHFLSNADENTKWLDSVAIADVLTNSTFELSELKTKPTTIYLVLPAHLLNEHGRFLRLFARSAIDCMAKGGTRGGRETLFLLDEFFSLGRIDEIAKSAGLMPGYGVKLWPFLQDLNQLVDVYGREGAGTFFGNSDFHQFFGTTDKETLDYISHRVGATTIEEIPLPPGTPAISGIDIGSGIASISSGNKYYRATGAVLGGAISALGAMGAAAEQAEHQDAMNKYQREMSRLGKPRIPPDEVAALVQLKDDLVADGSVCFVYGAESYYIHLAPYFRPLEEEEVGQPATVNKPASRRWGLLDFAAGFVALMLAGSSIGPLSKPSTVPLTTWPFLHVTWTVLTLILVGILALRLKTRRPPRA